MFLPSQSNIPAAASSQDTLRYTPFPRKKFCFFSPKIWPISIMLKYPASFLHVTFFHLRSSYCHELFKQIYPFIHFKICLLSKLYFTPRCLLYRIKSFKHANPIRELLTDYGQDIHFCPFRFQVILCLICLSVLLLDLRLKLSLLQL
jgi:hypothetical protein